MLLSMMTRYLRHVVSALGLAGTAYRIHEYLIRSNPAVILRNAKYHSEGAPDALPLPPAHLIYLVAGTSDIDWFLKSSSMSARTVSDALARQGAAIEHADAILEFGCGCGRVMRRWRDFPKTRVYGTDYNPELVSWCRANLPFAEFARNPLNPHLEYRDAQFDVVYAISVDRKSTRLN